jgi:hypothetical protein
MPIHGHWLARQPWDGIRVISVNFPQSTGVTRCQSSPIAFHAKKPNLNMGFVRNANSLIGHMLD